MQLYQHQKNLLDKNPKKHLIAWGTGTGKTLTAIELVKKNTDNCLIICPKSIKQQWLDIIKKERCDPLKWIVITKEEFKKAVDLQALSGYDAIICDEAHYFSGMQSLKKKSGMLKALLLYIKINNPEYIYLLTATPYLSSPLNIYALADILGRKWDYKAYKDLFFSMVNMGQRWPVPVVKKKVAWNGKIIPTEHAIANLVAKLGDTVALEDCVDMPEQIFQIEYFDLTAEQKKAIKNLDDINHIVFWTKCHQICGGSLKSDGYTEDKFYKSEKLDRALQLIQEHKKIIIICRYNNEIDYIYKKIQEKKMDKNKRKQRNTFKITGNIKDRGRIIQYADKEDEAVLLINAACSEGYELPSFPIMVFYSYDFSLKNYIQILGRIQRINNIKKNVYLSLIVKNTIDADVYKSIQRKEDFQLAIYKK